MNASESFFANLWEIFLQGGGYMLLGFGLAGIVRTLFARHRLARFFGGSAPLQSAKGVLIGAPLPICSCGVVPVSLALSRGGVPRPALMSFLIATPETGVASILISFALLGPLFTWLRPLLAVITAFVAGCLIVLWDRGREPDWTQPSVSGPESRLPADDTNRSWTGFLFSSLKSGFVEILDDVAFWLVVGIILSAAVATVLPPNSLVGLSPWLALVLALVAGLPLYMCAVASTPVAMALLAKGLVPGAALVFLLVGPTTNIGTLSLLYKFFGRRFVLLYVTVVAACALAAGAALNLLDIQSPLTHEMSGPVAGGFSWVSWVLASLLTLLLLISLFRTGLRTGLAELFAHLDSLTLGRATPFGLAVLRALGDLGRWLYRAPARRLVTLGTLCALAALLNSVFIQVPPGNEAFVLRCGRIASGPLPAGLHLKLPWPIEQASILPVGRLQQIQVGFHIAVQPGGDLISGTPVGSLDMQHRNATVLTSDELLVEIPFTVRYRVHDPRRYYFELADAQGLLESLAEEAVRESARAASFDGIVSRGRSRFGADCEHRLEELLRKQDLGIELLGILLVDSHPQANTADAFRSVSDALEDRATRIEIAGAKRIGMIAGAKGEGARLSSKAMQHAANTMAEARGRTLAFAGLREAYYITPGLTRLRLRLEAAGRALSAPSKWILPSRAPVSDLWFGLPAWAASSGGK
ncbi:MAG TPA: permease [Myxococcota bacterium]|nr:permease [Myxococcota bacterium]